MKVDEGLNRKGTGKVEQCAASVPDGCVEGDTEAVRDGGRKCSQEVHRLRDGAVAEEEGSLLCVAPVVKSDDAVDDAGVGGQGGTCQLGDASIISANERSQAGHTLGVD